MVFTSNIPGCMAILRWLLLHWRLPFFYVLPISYLLVPFTQAEAKAIGEIMTENDEQPAIARRPMFSEETLVLLKKQLLEKMENDQPYLDPDLNLPELARDMQLSVHEMSQLVNEGFAENFAQFINRYRVEESKRLLLSGK